MNILKKTLTSALVLTALSSFASAVPFEQNGVKEGNDKLSVALYTTFPDEGDESISINGQYGHFFSDDIEVLLDVFSSTSQGETFYMLSPGVNYYFAKTPTLTPYVGAQVYYYDTTISGIDPSFGNKLAIGAHKFFNENVAVTPEAGAQFYEFEDYLQSYVNLYLTYFFN